MDGCDYNEAFPNGPFGTVNCIDRTAGDESRRQERKKARRCRGPHATYLEKGMSMVGTDPDRPAAKPMEPVPALNLKTGLTEHSPVTQQYAYESFVGEMDDLAQIRKHVEGANELQNMEAPSFFGASPDDSSSTSIVNKRNVKEGFSSQVAPFTDVIGTQESYTLFPDFAKTFSTTGTQKPTGVPVTSGPTSVATEASYLTPTGMMPNSILPVPNVDMFWKTNGIAGGQSAFFSQLRSPGGQPVGTATEYDDERTDNPMGRREVLTKLDKIFARLDDMDATNAESAQTEVLLFILTGLGVIFLMDVGCRAASAFTRRR
jgi:hypothetical protein